MVPRTSQVDAFCFGCFSQSLPAVDLSGVRNEEQRVNLFKVPFHPKEERGLVAVRLCIWKTCFGSDELSASAVEIKSQTPVKSLRYHEPYALDS